LARNRNRYTETATAVPHARWPRPQAAWWEAHEPAGRAAQDRPPRTREARNITALGCHTFRATGITVYLLNGAPLEYSHQMAAHESARTTKLYDRRNDQITLDQIERSVL
jgi:hypothetical protein